MNLLCGLFQNFWTKFYNSCVRNVSYSVRCTVGLGMILGALLLFVLSTKGSKKGEMVGSWTLFWLSAILLVAGVIYLNLK